MTTTTAKPDIKRVNDYIINAIDSDGYDNNQPNTKEGKLTFLYSTFKDEYAHEIKRLGEQAAMAQWIQGLPSSFNIDYQYCRIIEIAKDFGSIPDGLSGKALQVIEDKICNGWFNWIAAKTISLIRKNAATA